MSSGTPTGSRILGTTTYSQFWILFGELLVALVILMGPAQADFIIDDTNSTVDYVGVWFRDDASILNASELFDGTV